jgi:hypothetical protein
MRKFNFFSLLICSDGFTYYVITSLRPFFRGVLRLAAAAPAGGRKKMLCSACPTKLTVKSSIESSKVRSASLD